MVVKVAFNSFMEKCEQNLVDELVAEVIQIHGINVHYIVRSSMKEDYLFGEDPLSQFDDSYEIEMYLETFEQFEGDGDLLSKFGLHIKDQATLTVNKTRFVTETGLRMPREGDLLYVPVIRIMLEIRFVEDEEQFFALGRNYQFKLKCQAFEYSREDFNTGVEAVDVITDNLDDSDGGTGKDIYGDATKLETEADAAIDTTQSGIFGDT